MAENKRSSQPMMPGRGPGHGAGAMMGRQKPRVKDARKTIKRLASYLADYKLRLTAVLLLVLVASLQSMLTPWFISIGIDRFIIPGNLRGLAGLVWLMAGLLVIVAFAGWLQQYLMISITQRSLGRIRRNLFSHLQALDLKYHDSHTHGELMSRFTNDIDNINNAMTQVVTQFLNSLFSIAGVMIMMFLLNVPLALVTLATVPLIFLITRFIGSKTRENFRNQQKLLGQINGQIEETITGSRIVKLFCREGAMAASLDEKNEQLKQAAVKAQVMAGMMGPLMNLTNNLRYAVVAAAGGLLAMNGMLSLGLIAAFLNYTRQFGRPVSQLAQLYNSLLSALAGAERVFDVMDQRPAVFSSSDAAQLSDIRGDVSFEDITFGYDEKLPVLSDVNLKAAPGQTIALVGPTGAGKTTIVNLLTRFYDVQKGRIMLDGQDIRDYDLDSLRQSLGLVLQDTFLFSGTVMDNLRYGNQEAGEEEVMAASRASRAHHFIRHLPDGYYTELSENGQNLSQGQRQLIAIARVILADPSILILDEATSNVDTRTEQHIQEGMLQLMKGRTSFVIAHRLSTIRNADLILVLKDGRIIERGTHDQLLDMQGFYAGLHQDHFEAALH